MKILACWDGLGNRYPVTVDEDIYERLKDVSIRMDGWGYPAFSLDCTSWTVGVFVLGKCAGHVVDHIDGNKMNCIRNNLRHATKSQNALNAGAHKDNPTGYKGVSKHGQCNTYRARLKIGKQLFEKNGFKTPEEAAQQINNWIILTGITAPLNVIPVIT